jgi:hypothetical protein
MFKLLVCFASQTEITSRKYLEITIIKRSLADVNLKDKIASAPKHNSMTVCAKRRGKRFTHSLSRHQTELTGHFEVQLLSSLYYQRLGDLHSGDVEKHHLWAPPPPPPTHHTKKTK